VPVGGFISCFIYILLNVQLGAGWNLGGDPQPSARQEYSRLGVPRRFGNIIITYIYYVYIAIILNI
jgi:hypothetical protein